MNDIEAYASAQAYVDVDLVRLEPRRASAEAKVETALAFNAALGDPQRACPAVQVAGTSGKGGVCALVAGALWESGLRVGLHVSPYLQVFTEKTWIDGRALSVEGLSRAVEVVRPVAERFRQDPEGPASVHGMASLGVSYVAFAEAQAQLTVLETGVGGRFDLVQGLDLALAVITDLGLDHPQALGTTIEQVAWHKAGIMRQGVPCVAMRAAGWSVLEAEAARVGAPLTGVDPAEVVVGAEGRRLRLELETLGAVEVTLASEAPFGRRNAALAAAALDALARDGWPVTREGLVRGFARQILPGRFEEVQASPRVLLDGAHNAQKVDALLEALGRPERLVAVVAASGRRAPRDLLARLAPRCDLLLATALDLYGKTIVPTAALARAAREAGCAAREVASPEVALDAALDAAGSGGTVLVTGSLYLIGRLRDRWYPWREVLRQGTSWPQRGTKPKTRSQEGGLRPWSGGPAAGRTQ